MTRGSPSGLPDIVLLSTADWDNPFWTNKQHVALALARRGHRVLYIESLGLRRPAASAADLGRVARRIRRALLAPRQVREGLWVCSPLAIPFQRHGVVRRLNKWLLSLSLSIWMRRLRLQRDLLWTYNPMTQDLLALAGFKRVVYHCVDEIKAQPGMPAADIERAERDLLLSADLCFVTAEPLLEPRRGYRARLHYFPNVADYDHFAGARSGSTSIPFDLARLPAPRIGFVGAISGYKLDFPLLRRLAESHPEWSIVLIGKIGEGDPWTDTDALRGLPNLHLLGPRDYRALPAYLKGFQTAILPGVINDYTCGMFPMKFFEYLAAGCPVVSTELPALRGYGDVAMLARTPEEFIAAIERSIQGECAPLEARLAVARQHTYEQRTTAMMALVEA